MVLIGDLPAPVSAIVAEGIEDALTGACLTGVAAIATLGSGRLPKLSLEKGAQVVLLAQQKSDKDQLLWDKAGQIFAAQGAQVEIVWPGNRGDINELLTTDGPEAVKAALADAEPVVVKPDAPVASEGDIPDLDGMNAVGQDENTQWVRVAVFGERAQELAGSLHTGKASFAPEVWP